MQIIMGNGEPHDQGRDGHPADSLRVVAFVSPPPEEDANNESGGITETSGRGSVLASADAPPAGFSS
jgi:hypothetical protein